ncbi:MAG: TerB family tellurite resistance protein [Fluviicola sp.]|nr:TerB family tellurite resistance protein [Fluviicola sp.]
MGTIAQLFESGKQSSDKGLFKNLVMLARVDGKIDDAEVKLLARTAKRLSLTSEQVAEIIGHPDSYPMTPPISKEERYERFIDFIQMVVVDGIVDPAEEQLVAKYGIALGFSSEQIEECEPVIMQCAMDGCGKEEILRRFVLE